MLTSRSLGVAMSRLFEELALALTMLLTAFALVWLAL
jgi:hypothetical protein